MDSEERRIVAILSDLQVAVAEGDRAAAMLCGMAAASQALLVSRDLEAGMATALEMIVGSSGVDRCSIFERVPEADGADSFRRVAFATREGVDTRKLEAAASLSPRALGAEHWSKQILEGRAVIATTSELEDSPVRDSLQRFGIACVNVVPLKSRDRVWGFVGFFNLSSSRPWTSAERCVLSSAGASLSFAIGRAEAEARHLELQQRYMRAQKRESLALLAAGVAHDMANLLTILGVNDDDDPDVAGAVAQGRELCQQLMVYARGGDEQHREPVQLDVLASEMSRLVAARFGDQVELDTSAIEEVPRMSADPTQLRQVILNLVTNAVQAASRERERGRGRVTVATRFVAKADESHLGDAIAGDKARPGAYVELMVADDGPGIPEDIRARIFDPMFTTRSDGNGLGLATVLGIARAHGGAVFVDSAAGKGARFRVWLPTLWSEP